ncbi:MAG: alpha/beta hydrolase [Clostridia bacterium]|nr:alpha/beta hydrolase [Clostridia bacterium]
MSKVLLLHGYNGVPKVFEWLRDELTNKGYQVIVPEFPVQENARYHLWKDILDNYKDELTDELIVIGHSIGNRLIVKYLHENQLNIKLYISLAGFSDVYKIDGREDLYNAVKDFEISEQEINNFKEQVEKKYCIYSNDDHIVPFDVLERYPVAIDGIPMLIKGIGHMGKKSNVVEIPKVLEIINKKI